MARLGDTYDRAPESGAAIGKPSQGSTRINDGVPLPARESICFGDVIAVLFGGVVFCFGVVFWMSPAIGQFNSSLGMQRLAELTTNLGINTIVIWGLLLYSLGRETRSPGESPRLDSANGLARLPKQYQIMNKVFLLIGPFVSESEQDRL